MFCEKMFFWKTPTGERFCMENGVQATEDVNSKNFSILQKEANLCVFYQFLNFPSHRRRLYLRLPKAKKCSNKRWQTNRADNLYGRIYF
jgi:hypothetical protein